MQGPQPRLAEQRQRVMKSGPVGSYSVGFQRSKCNKWQLPRTQIASRGDNEEHWEAIVQSCCLSRSGSGLGSFGCLIPLQPPKDPGVIGIFSNEECCRHPKSSSTFLDTVFCFVLNDASGNSGILNLRSLNGMHLNCNWIDLSKIVCSVHSQCVPRPHVAVSSSDSWRGICF